MSNLKKLPNNVNALKEIVSDLKNKNQALETNNEILLEEIELLKKRLFAPKSERFCEDDQDFLFNEAEMGADEIEDDTSSQEDTVEVPSYKRKKKGPKKYPASLPREVIDIDIDEQDKICVAGKTRKFIGWKTSEKLDIKPPKITVIVTRRAVYGCPDNTCIMCEDEDQGPVRTAPKPPQLLNKTRLTSGLAAFLISSKYCDHLPLYRQEGILKRYGVDISRQTMCRWIIRLYEKLAYFIELFQKEILSGPLIGMDETTLQVLAEPKRKAQSKSYLWVFRGGNLDSPTILFMYRESHSGNFLLEYLKDYEGAIQTDGYQVYNCLSTIEGIDLAACWAHARRKFDEAAKASKNKGSAYTALSKIKQLYLIEKKIKDATPEEKVKIRQQEAGPKLDDIKKWLDKKQLQVLPKSLIGKAINYTLKLWPKLITYTKNGYIPIDNNGVENALRPECLGKKNWLFSITASGANASAFFYSLIETAKANKIDPYWYLRYLFEQVTLGVEEKDLKKLMPQYIDKRAIREYHRPAGWR